MSTVLGFRDMLDVPMWRTMAVAPNATIAGGCLACDNRNSEDRDPHIFFLPTGWSFRAYHTKNDEWMHLASPALAGSVAAGAVAAFAASAGPSGVVGGGCTPTHIVLSTALPAAVGVNQLANRGDGIGFKIRVYGNITGGSGTTEESFIVANTAGTTPTLVISPALTFTPGSGSRFEILSGRVMLIASGMPMVGSIRAYDVATNFFITIAHGNLPSIGTDSSVVMLDELYVPHTRHPGEGFFGNLVCTGSALGSLTGHTAGGDAGVVANEYRNFQIRIVRDTTNPTAVGQRRIIASHTGGAGPVYTLSANWAVVPSVGATYVIENNNDLILFTGALANVSSYRLGGFTTPGTWSVTGTVGTTGAIAYAGRGVAMGTGCTSFPSYGITLDTDKNARHSHLFSFRGGGTVHLDLLDIAGGPNGLWTPGIAYGGSGGNIFGMGTHGAYDPATRGGRYGYVNINAAQRFARFDVRNRVLEAFTYLPYAQGASLVGNKLAVMPFVDGTTKLGMLYAIQSGGAIFWNVVLQR